MVGSISLHDVAHARHHANWSMTFLSTYSVSSCWMSAQCCWILITDIFKTNVWFVAIMIDNGLPYTQRLQLVWAVSKLKKNVHCTVAPKSPKTFRYPLKCYVNDCEVLHEAKMTQQKLAILLVKSKLSWLSTNVIASQWFAIMASCRSKIFTSHSFTVIQCA